MKYFMQCGWSGNDALWWRKDKSGYTTNLDEAHVFTKDEARQVENVRDEDVAHPVNEVLRESHRAISQAELKEVPPECTRCGRHLFECIGCGS